MQDFTLQLLFMLIIILNYYENYIKILLHDLKYYFILIHYL